MSVSPLRANEFRREILTFEDGSEIEVDQYMRDKCRPVYMKTCMEAVSRRMIGRGGCFS